MKQNQHFFLTTVELGLGNVEYSGEGGLNSIYDNTYYAVVLKNRCEVFAQGNFEEAMRLVKILIASEEVPNRVKR